MTTRPPRAGVRMGRLGRRLTAAFVGVAAMAVLLVSGAALVGTGRGLDTVSAKERADVADRVAAAAAFAYQEAGGWADADLGPASAIAAAAGADLIVLDMQSRPVEHGDGQTNGPGDGTGHGAGGTEGNGKGRNDGEGGSGPSSGNERPGGDGSGGSGRAVGRDVGATAPVAHEVGPAGSVTAPVMVEGAQVGTVRLVFRVPAADAARTIAWSWIALAAGVALGLALLAARLVTQRVARPLSAVAGTARAFAAGDRAARTGVDGPGEIGDVARALDEMADEVATSELARRRAAADVAHELRTPLAALQAGLEELRDGLVTPDATVLAGLHDQSLRLGRIVADLAALSAAEGNALRLRLDDLDLAALVREEVAAQEPRLRAADLQVSVDAHDKVTVYGDADRLRQVLDNLLSNAARYCRPGDSVAVSVSVAEDEGHAVLEVADTGPGIVPHDLPHVFDRLWRGHEADRVGGSGIGLAVVRELVTAHSGTVTAESDGSNGTTLRVELPLSS